MENEAHAIILPGTEDLVFWLLSLAPVFCLLLWDVYKAWKRWAVWIPGQALMLSAFIILLLSFIDYSHVSVYSGGRYQTKEVVAILVKNQLVIDSGRLMTCVLIAYLLPGMACSGSIMELGNLTVLTLRITFHVVSEIRSVWKVGKRNESLSALAALSEVFHGIISNFVSTFLIVAIIYLLMLLIEAVMISRTIRRIMSQKIPSAISSCCTPSGTPCIDIKHHVLKCWIVVRLSQTDYVLSRSGLCSMVWPVVTVCIVGHVYNWRYVQFTDTESLNSVIKGRLVQLVIVGQVVIFVIGWIVLFLRWVNSDRQLNIFGVYYFYPTSLKDLLSELSARFIRLFGRDERIQEKRIRDMNKKIGILNPRHWVETLFQVFSMQYPPHWLSIIKQKLSNIKTCVSASVPKKEVSDPQFEKYKGTVEMFLIQGECARKLWKANQWGFEKVERYMEQGQKDGKCSPSELSDLLGLETGTPEGEAEEFDLLLQANKNSWKRTAVSLIHFMIYYFCDGSDPSVIEKAMQCYTQGWEYMNFVDGLNEEVKALGSQADGEFDSLQHSWNKGSQPEIKKRLDQLKSCPDEEGRKLQNSRDSTDGAKYCLLETWTVINRDLSEPEINNINKIDWLQRALATVYFFCMRDDVDKAVIEKCSKLAEEGMEEEILKVAFLAAKAEGVLYKGGERYDLENQVEPGHNTDQPSTSSNPQGPVRRRTNISPEANG